MDAAARAARAAADERLPSTADAPTVGDEAWWAEAGAGADAAQATHAAASSASLQESRQEDQRAMHTVVAMRPFGRIAAASHAAAVQAAAQAAGAAHAAAAQAATLQAAAEAAARRRAGRRGAGHGGGLGRGDTGGGGGRRRSSVDSPRT